MSKFYFAALITLLVCATAHAEKILMIGDSLSCGPFGQQMVKNLAADGANDVTLYCAISSAPTHWLNGKNPPGQKCQTMTSESMTLHPCGGTGRIPKLAAILADHPNERMVVALGTNSLGAKKADHSYRVMAEDVARAGSQCQWIGPPRLHPSQAKGFSSSRLTMMDGHNGSFFQSLDASLADVCPVVDSRPYTEAGTKGYATADGVHRTKAAGTAWANAMMGKINGAKVGSAAAATVSESSGD